MLLVVDSNIALSSLIAGNLTRLILSPRIELAAPELLFEEINKHREEALAKSRLSANDFDILLALLEKKIRLFPMDEFISFMPEAEKLLGEHRKDAPYVALALKLNCPFWSYEKRFKRSGRIESLTAEEVRKMVEPFSS